MCECEDCGAAFSERRAALGYRLCLTCGEKAAREQRAGWCVAPIAHKQGATLVTQREQLRGLNKVVPT
jgi:RNA polymerase-binding transcription factor DksA